MMTRIAKHLRFLVLFLTVLALLGCGNSEADLGIVPASARESVPGTAFLDGLAAYEKEQFEEARKHLTRAAADGNAEAMYRLGLLSETGVAGKTDIADARNWYAKAWAGGFVASRGTWVSKLAIEVHLSNLRFRKVAKMFAPKDVGDLSGSKRRWGSLYAAQDLSAWVFFLYRQDADTGISLAAVRFGGRDLALLPFHKQHKLMSNTLEFERDGKTLRLTRGQIAESYWLREKSLTEELLAAGGTLDEGGAMDEILGHRFRWEVSDSEGEASAIELGYQATEFTPYMELFYIYTNKEGYFPAAQGTVTLAGKDTAVATFFAAPAGRKTPWRATLSSLEGSTFEVNSGMAFELTDWAEERINKAAPTP